MKRKIFVSIVISLAILGVVSYYGINYVYDIIGDKMINHLNSIQDSIVDDKNLEGIVGTDGSDNGNNFQKNQIDVGSGDTKTSVSSSDRQNVNNDSAAKQSKNITGDRAENVSNGQDKNGNAQKGKEPVEISLSDKLKAIRLVTSKLSPSDIAKLERLAKGGFTPEEKKEAIAIAYSRFTPEEIQEIKKLYHKYVR